MKELLRWFFSYFGIFIVIFAIAGISIIIIKIKKSHGIDEYKIKFEKELNVQYQGKKVDLNKPLQCTYDENGLRGWWDVAWNYKDYHKKIFSVIPFNKTNVCFDFFDIHGKYLYSHDNQGKKYFRVQKIILRNKPGAKEVKGVKNENK